MIGCSDRVRPMSFSQETARRRTFAIISHPDAGKTTITEKLLLFGGAIQLAGTVKGRKSARHATSDWMAMEKERGISVTSSVMQFPYRDRIVNLLDTITTSRVSSAADWRQPSRAPHDERPRGHTSASHTCIKLRKMSLEPVSKSTTTWEPLPRTTPAVFTDTAMKCGLNLKSGFG
jgi:hypothetical protein